MGNSTGADEKVSGGSLCSAPREQVGGSAQGARGGSCGAWGLKGRAGLDNGDVHGQRRSQTSQSPPHLPVRRPPQSQGSCCIRSLSPEGTPPSGARSPLCRPPGRLLRRRHPHSGRGALAPSTCRGHWSQWVFRANEDSQQISPAATCPPTRKPVQLLSYYS